MTDPAQHVDVAHIAQLARLELTEAEIVGLQRNIEEVLGYVEQLLAVDVTGVEPTAHAAPIANVFRADEAGPTLDRDAALANAPALIDAVLIKVPVVLGGDEPGDA